MTQPKIEKSGFSPSPDGDPSPSNDGVARTHEGAAVQQGPDASVSYDTTEPTTQTYLGLTEAYAFFNERLFANKLPPCLITLQRRRGAYGYFSGQRFTTRDGTQATDEIALNPRYFAERSIESTLATLVHEMVHLQQEHFGKPSRGSYHNQEWARMMRAVGLIPSSTGEPGGKETGQRVSHYIEEDGRFALACADLLATRTGMVPFVEAGSEADRETREKKAACKTKYTCPGCGANAWAKPETGLGCTDCNLPLEAAPAKMTTC